ncbi:MAG: hypothetical protein CR996_00705 [Draconibacterium sp.]|nr:MAG: hypothetical protein CR996_00705 [Draconibacterium sp.]PIF05230.1 MAG: hypothetical protein CSA36_07845 [Draconibacterium sp.]
MIYKVHLAKLDNQIIKTFTDNEVELLKESIDKLVESSKRNWSYYFIENNRKILTEQTNKTLSELSTKRPNTWKDLEQAFILMNFYFMNYLTSINTFLDQNLNFLSKRFGKDSNEKIKFKELTSELFDKYFEYRLLYKLRNYTVHAEFSICGISSEEKMINPNTKRVSYTPCILKGELLKNKSYLGAIVTKDIEERDNNISIFDLIHKSIKHYELLQEHTTKIVNLDDIKHKKEIINILEITEDEYGKYQLIIEDDNQVKVAQIPYHYLK